MKPIIFISVILISTMLSFWLCGIPSVADDEAAVATCARDTVCSVLRYPGPALATWYAQPGPGNTRSHRMWRRYPAAWVLDSLRWPETVGEYPQGVAYNYLPIGTPVLIRSIETGKSFVGEVRDRIGAGNVDGIDLTRPAFESLGIPGKIGETWVEIWTKEE